MMWNLFLRHSTMPTIFLMRRPQQWMMMMSQPSNLLLEGIITRGMAKSTLKRNKSVTKRFRLRGNGEIRRSKAGRSHNTGYKTRARKNRLAESTGIKERSIEKRIRQMLGA